MAKSNGENENTTINLISQGTEITGDIKSNGDIRIDGILTGTLFIRGKVVIGATGKVKGEVSCKNSEISGSVEGKVTVSQLLNLKASSTIQGDIVTSKLAIEPGARFTGTCKMNETEENAGSNNSRGQEKPGEKR